MNRAIVAAACAVIALITCTVPAAAEWPADKPIRVLVGFGPGGGTDIVTRIIAQPLSELLHQTVVVENKPGAGGSLASDMVAKADKDGYTASMISAGHTVSAVMIRAVRYDAIKDFAPVARVADSAFVVIARKDFPASDIKGLVALAKASPGKLNFASVGVGSTQHFAGELLAQMTGIKVTHIPFRGTPALMTALLAGQVDYGVELVHAVQGQVQAGNLKILAVGSTERWPTIPNVPTVAESGLPGFDYNLWVAVFGPAALPQDLVARINADMQKVAAMPEIRERLAGLGAEPMPMNASEFRRFVRNEIQSSERVVKDAHIVAQ